MAIICVCDLCGKPMNEDYAVHYVVKKRNRFYTLFEDKWKYVDAHEACMEKLFRVAEKQDDDEEQDDGLKHYFDGSVEP